MEIGTDLLIIGAGPFAFATAAYAKHLGIDHMVVGKPMEFWKTNMPKGLYLRSACDWHLDPLGRDTIERFLASQGLTPDQVEPLSLDLYLRYAQWFQEQKEITPLAVHVRRLDYSAKAARFQAVTDDDRTINAGQVVVAVGFKYFKHVPLEIARLVPPPRLSHTCDQVTFDGLRDKRCLIIGGRQSAFEWAALIHEAGARIVHICHRHDTPAFKASDWSWVNPLVDRIAREPGWFRNLSAAAKKEIQDHLWAEGRLKIEPWLESRVLKDGIKLWPRCQMADCIEVPDGSLSIKLDNGETVIADHVIAATGYEVNIANVPFLTDGNLLRQLAVGNGFAELDDHLQTNIPGLFITSMAAVHDFGPFWAFTAAARASAQIIGSVLHAGRKAARIGDGSNAV